MSCVPHAFVSVHCCLVATDCERAYLLALVGDVYCIFVTFPCGILGKVWYFIVSFPDLCLLSYFSLKYVLTGGPARVGKRFMSLEVRMVKVTLSTCIAAWFYGK